MAWGFVVESKLLARVTDLVDSSRHTRPLQRRGFAHRTRPSGILRPQRHGPQRMLNIGDHQLLVLLLVVKSQFDQRPELLITAVEQSSHLCVHPLAIRLYFFEAGPRHQTPRTAIRMGSKLLVVRIEQLAELRTERAIALHVWAQ